MYIIESYLVKDKIPKVNHIIMRTFDLYYIRANEFIGNLFKSSAQTLADTYQNCSLIIIHSKFW